MLNRSNNLKYKYFIFETLNEINYDYITYAFLFCSIEI